MNYNKHIYFVLGGPGAGKGTACLRLQEKYKDQFIHFSAGDLLRKCAQEFQDKDEQDPDFKICQVISDCIKQGLIVPAEITIKLLMSEIQKCQQKYILVDGFPRNQENYQNWIKINEQYPNLIVQKLLYFECDYKTLWQRIQQRAEQSQIQRADDNEESFKKRLQVLEEQTSEVCEEFKKNGKLVLVNSNKTMDEVEKFVYQNTVESSQ